MNEKEFAGMPCCMECGNTLSKNDVAALLSLLKRAHDCLEESAITLHLDWAVQGPLSKDIRKALTRHGVTP